MFEVQSKLSALLYRLVFLLNGMEKKRSCVGQRNLGSLGVEGQEVRKDTLQT